MPQSGEAWVSKRSKAQLHKCKDNRMDNSRTTSTSLRPRHTPCPGTRQVITTASRTTKAGMPSSRTPTSRLRCRSAVRMFGVSQVMRNGAIFDQADRCDLGPSLIHTWALRRMTSSTGRCCLLWQVVRGTRIWSMLRLARARTISGVTSIPGGRRLSAVKVKISRHLSRPLILAISPEIKTRTLRRTSCNNYRCLSSIHNFRRNETVFHR